MNFINFINSYFVILKKNINFAAAYRTPQIVRGLPQDICGTPQVIRGTLQEARGTPHSVRGTLQGYWWI
jgi:hypothetical protein